MTNDKTVTMSLELVPVPRKLVELTVDFRLDHANVAELREILAAPVVERQPIAEVQHGPFNDVGAPKWVRVVTLGDFDLENIPDGTKLYTSPGERE